MWKGLRRLRDSPVFIAPAFTHTSSKRSNRLACVPHDTPSIPHFLSFNRARVENCTEISHESSGKAQELNCWISKRRTIQPKWNEWKQNFREETFEKLGTPRLFVLFFPKFWKLLVYLILEVARNLNWRFWLNGICEVGVGWRSGRGFPGFGICDSLTTLLIFSDIWHPMVCNLYFASRVGDNCRKFLQQLGFLHLSYLFAVVFQRSSQLFNFSGEKDELL